MTDEEDDKVMAVYVDTVDIRTCMFEWEWVGNETNPKDYCYTQEALAVGTGTLASSSWLYAK